MKIRFTEVVSVEFITDVCCFSGSANRSWRTMAIGEVLEVVDVPRVPNEPPKVKTRPGVPKQRPWYQFILDDGDFGTLHPNAVNHVPAGSFEVVS